MSQTKERYIKCCKVLDLIFISKEWDNDKKATYITTKDSTGVVKKWRSNSILRNAKKIDPSLKNKPKVLKASRFCETCKSKFVPSSNNQRSCKTCSKTITCLFCHTDVAKTTVRKSEASYCDNSCYQNHLFQLFIERWKAGEEDGITKAGKQFSISSYIRRYMLEKAEYRCEKCSIELFHPDDGKTVLQLNHIDGDALNNNEKNLEILCPNCHSMTSNWCARNRKSSRYIKS